MEATKHCKDAVASPPQQRANCKTEPISQQESRPTSNTSGETFKRRLSAQIAHSTVSIELGRDGLVISLREAGILRLRQRESRDPKLRQRCARLRSLLRALATMCGLRATPIPCRSITPSLIRTGSSPRPAQRALRAAADRCTPSPRNNSRRRICGVPSHRQQRHCRGAGRKSAGRPRGDAARRSRNFSARHCRKQDRMAQDCRPVNRLLMSLPAP